MSTSQVKGEPTYAKDESYSVNPKWMSFSEVNDESAWGHGWMNSYIVRSYRDVIVVAKIATRRTSKAQSIVLKQKHTK